MAFRGTLLICISFCVLAVNAKSFVDLVCEDRTVGELGHRSMLNCIIKPRPGIEDVNVVTVVWKKLNPDKTAGKTVLFFKSDTPFKPEPSYTFAEPSWNKKIMNVSLLITSTKLEDEGDYICDVMTDSGRPEKKITSLKVTAKYNEPTVNITKEKSVPQADKALVCRAQGGYPPGKLCWFDGDRNEWTKSADMEVKKMDDGLYELSSKLPLLPLSTFSVYVCVVYNSIGGKEEEIVFKPDNTAEIGQDKPSDTSISKIVAPAVVIGSLVVGLLFALLIYRRRTNQVRRPSSTPFLDERHQCPTEEFDDGAP